MSEYGYIGATAPTQSETTGNTGVFSLEEIKGLKDDNKFQKNGPVVEYLAIAGGGGGKNGSVSGGGGGGAGEVRNGSFATQIGVVINVDIGAGGGNNGAGQDTIIDEAGTELFRCKGGGTNAGPREGGSGGGGAYGSSPNVGGNSLAYQFQDTTGAVDHSTVYLNTDYGMDLVGHRGGTAGGGDGRNGAGGGGASGAGGDCGGRTSGGGGAATPSSGGYEVWAAATSSGNGNRYAGGGGGASFSNTAGGGGGGAGNGGYGNGGSAQANTGSGGGAGGAGYGDNNGTTGNGGNGGSGIFILRYSDTLPDAASTTGAPTLYTTGGYKYYKFNGDGSITF